MEEIEIERFVKSLFVDRDTADYDAPRCACGSMLNSDGTCSGRLGEPVLTAEDMTTISAALMTAGTQAMVRNIKGAEHLIALALKVNNIRSRGGMITVTPF